MNNKVLTSWVLFAAVVGLLGCDSSSPIIDPISADVELDASFNGEELSILRGQVVVVTLASNPSTGFTWSVEDVDSSILRQMGLPEYQPGGSGLLGAEGVQIFRFQSVDSGTTDIKIIYSRPFEEGEEPAERFEVRITVR
jgi:inhibitor of cysteine peptidase